MKQCIDKTVRRVIWVLGASSLILHPSSLAMADGGTVRLCQRVGNHQVAVFTSPTPLRAGPVDVSVLVQDPTTGECTPGAEVMLRLTAHGSGLTLEYPATSAAATNKLFQAADFELPEAGVWEVEVSVKGPQGPVSARFQLEAGEALPRWLDLWPWYTWPALVVVLFGFHQVLTRRTRRSSSNPAPTRRSAGGGAGLLPAH
jgi:hypothetical protein